jgi:hypothetical protein
MRTLAPIALVSALLVACTGEPNGSSSSAASKSSVGNPPSSSSVRSIASSSLPRSSSSLAPVTSSSAPVTSSSKPLSSSSLVSSSSKSSVAISSSSAATGLKYSDFVGDPLKGAQRYGAVIYGPFACQTCHGLDANGDGKTESTTPIVPGKFTAQALFEEVLAMPTDAVKAISPTRCDGQCAADITAYLRTLIVEENVQCDSNKPIGYSPRALRLLTVDEYQNTLEDVLGLSADYTGKVVADARKGGFPNNNTANVDESRANKFWAASEELAKWAVENNKPFACGANESCSDRFIDEFLYRLFRRPVNNLERTQFEALFNNYPGKEGMEAALVAALNAPQFLYRSELGRKVSDVLAGTGITPEYRPANPIVVFKGADWGGGGIQADGSKKVDLYGNAGITFRNYTFTGNDVVKIRARGALGDGVYPTMQIKIDNKIIDTVVVNSASFKTFTYRVEGIVGTNKYIQVENKNAAGHSQSRVLYLGDITFGKAELYIPPKGDEAKLSKADPSSYVLDAFEYATLLAYTLTGSAPDQALLDAAAGDGLHYEADIRKQVERLIDSPRGRERIGAMAGYWFNTDKVTEAGADRNTALFPKYTASVRDAMKQEVHHLFREIFYGNRAFTDFYAGDFTVVNSVLANYYGIPATTTSPNDWVLVDGLDKRGGIVTTGAFMTVNAHPDKTAPIIRAVRVREQMLCQHILPPPLLVEDREALLAKVNAQYEAGIITDRQYYEGITDARSCDGCHKYQINPLFGMEDFDQVGQWRNTQKGATGMTLPIDITGSLFGPENIDDNATVIPFRGAKNLSKELAVLPGIKECLIEKTFRFVAGLPIKDKAVDPAEKLLTAEQKSDFLCVAEKAKAVYQSSGGKARAVLTEMVMQDLLRFRKAN